MPATCSHCHHPPQHAPLLDVQHLSVAFDSAHGVVHAVNGANWQLHAGECLAIVGESGSGKSISSLSIMGLLPPTAHISGRVLLDGRDILQLPEAQRRQLRGKDIGMVFQDPLSALNPVHRVGEQIAEAIRSHRRMSQKAALAQAVELLHEVGIPNPQERARDYPHQFSGGMRQRVVIAMALANNPRILIADEPTTALDVTVQAQIMELLARLREKRNTALVLITHDLGLVASQADRVLVMYAGRVVESAAVKTLFSAPRHHYTHGLLDSLTRIDAQRQQRLHPIPGQPPSLTDLPAGCAFHPRCAQASDTCRHAVPTLQADDQGHATACHHPSQFCSASIRHPGKAHGCDHHLPYSHTPHADDANNAPPVLEVERLCKTFHGGRPLLPWKKPHAVHAVRNVSLQVRAGETLGVVGESGCGKSSLSRCILRLHEPSSGVVRFCGQDLLRMNREQLRTARQHMQMVFQDPHGCLDPRYTVRELLSEPFIIHGLPISAERIDELLRRVGLAPEHASRYPHEFSGGQLQRIGIARAIALNPKLVICDEPVSALDVSIRAQIINLLGDLQAELGMSYLFIAHDLSVVRHIAHRVAVMYRGQIVETAEVEDLFANPQHPYTQALLSAVPVPDPTVERKRFVRYNDAQNGTPDAAGKQPETALLPIHPGSSHLVRRPVAA
ncbi:MAG: ABC transporter ATP-binding protein [Brachymonas sp.]|nr:ABC transporter ATP-binding protein [Brachymonas sp.]